MAGAAARFASNQPGVSQATQPNPRTALLWFLRPTCARNLRVQDRQVKPCPLGSFSNQNQRGGFLDCFDSVCTDSRGVFYFGSETSLFDKRDQRDGFDCIVNILRN